MGRTHSSRRLTKSGVSSVDHLSELASYAVEADPVDILGTGWRGYTYLFSCNHEGIGISIKGGRGEVPFGTQSCSVVGIGNEVVLSY